ncbi:MAG: hypothetical protein ACFE95_12330 [Candidatus Hodarchaeota archaeon]
MRATNLNKKLALESQESLARNDSYNLEKLILTDKSIIYQLDLFNKGSVIVLNPFELADLIDLLNRDSIKKEAIY